MRTFLILVSLFCFGLASSGYSQTIYASEKGEKYHTADCKLSGDAKEMTLATAKKIGKEPCGVCKPEQHFRDKTTQCKGKTADGTRCKRMTGDKGGKCFQHKAT